MGDIKMCGVIAVPCKECGVFYTYEPKCGCEE